MRNKFILPLATMLTVLVSLLLSGFNISAQTLQLRFPFEDAPGTTTASDTSSGGLAVTLNLENQTPGTAMDLHGAAGSGIQGQGRALDLSTNNISGTVAGTIAFVTNNANIGSIGLVSNFTASIWFKLVSPPTNTANTGSRLFIIGTNGTIDSGLTNTICLLFNTAAGFPSNTIAARLGATSQITLPLYSPLATNVWQFVALTYDGGSNAIMYYGTEASPAKLMTVNNIGAQTFNLGPTGNLQIGNRLNGRNRPLPGWIDDFRFYTGTGDANFVENIRKSSCPLLISGLTPDGSTLMEGTNTFAFTASSANTINTNAIKVSLNGADISSSLVFGGTPSAVTVSYSALPVNSTLINTANLNGATIGIQVTDASGIRATNLYTYDTFSPTNFTWEVEDYNYSTNDPPFTGGGNFIDNPRYAFVSAPDTYYQRFSELLDDYDDNANPAGPSRIYRSSLDAVETEYALGGAPNGGISCGELMRQKVLDALALDPTIREVNVGYFDGGTGADLPNWMNYTRTYPSGNFNVYTRVAAGTTGVSSALDLVTSGVGTEVQTTTNIGTFSMGNTGGWDSFAWVPLRDSGGNLVRLTLGGVATLRLTAGPAGGGNNNFLMLTPANTNLPTITGLYPNGTNLFQPASALTFTVSSPTGVTINTNSIHVQLTGTTITASFSTNLSATNGLVITGTASSRNVSAPLTANVSYVAVISATDVDGSPAGQTVTFDTYNPALTWDAEDYNFGGGQTFDPAITTDEYLNAVGTQEVDYHDGSATIGSQLYRPSDTAGTEVTGDSPLRLAYIGTGFSDYDVGWYDTGDWNNYTRTIPPGQWNVVLRAANGTTGNGFLTLSQVTSAINVSNQVTTNLGLFTIPATGGWQSYVFVPLRDSGGNLVKFTGTGAQLTLRGTSGSGLNANFYMLIAANTNLPIISNLTPDGTSFFQATNRLSFTVTANGGATINTNNVSVTLDGNPLTGLQFTGSSSSWNVAFTGLAQNTNHTATITVIDSNGNSASTSVSFDSFKSSYYTWEAEDYDYVDTNGVSGRFFDNPQVDAYTNLPAAAGIDFNDINTGGGYVYRPSGTATEITADTPRSQFAGGFDYDIGFFSSGEWGNYTRNYPAGNYNVWGRFAAGGGDTTAFLDLVTGGWGTVNQTSNLLGTFSIGNSGWSSFTWVGLRDINGNLVTVPLNGSTNTLKLSRPDPALALPDVNVNFLMLVPLASPVVLTATHAGANINISFQTTTGFSYQVQFKTNLTDASWTNLGSALTGDGTIKSVSDPASGTSRFYRVSVQ